MNMMKLKSVLLYSNIWSNERSSHHVSTELVVLPSRASISCSRSNLDVCFDQELIVEIKRSLKALCGPLPFSCEKTCTVLLRPVFLRVHALTIASIDNGYLLCAVTW